MNNKDTKNEVNKADFESNCKSERSSSDKIKEIKPKTLKQQWQFERTFYNVGSLAGVKSVLHRIVEAKSTLPIEVTWIRVALGYLEELKLGTNLEISWRMYEKRSKNDRDM